MRVMAARHEETPTNHIQPIPLHFLTSFSYEKVKNLTRVTPLFLNLRGRYGQKAFGKELILLLTGLLRGDLPHHLFAAHATPFGELAHVLAVTLALLLLCVDATGLELGGGSDGRSGKEGEGEKAWWRVEKSKV